MYSLYLRVSLRSSLVSLVAFSRVNIGLSFQWQVGKVNTPEYVSICKTPSNKWNEIWGG
jgi:hypothetical protein